MKGDAESTPTAEGGHPKMTSQESGYATQRTDKQPAGMSADMSIDEYGGARPNVKHPAEGRPKGFTPFALDDIVKGNLFDSPLPNSSTDTHRSGTSHVIKPATYDGTSSWLDYKGHFEAFAAVNGWTEESKGLFWAVSLRGHAQSVLGDLPSDMGQHYSTLVRSLEERFSPPNQTDLYRVQLKKRRQKLSESISELGHAIRRLTELAYASAPGEVRGTLAKDSFIDALTNSEMRIRIKQSRPQNLNEAIRLQSGGEAESDILRSSTSLKYRANKSSHNSRSKWDINGGMDEVNGGQHECPD